MTYMFDIHTSFVFGTAELQVNTRLLVNGTGFARWLVYGY